MCFLLALILLAFVDGKIYSASNVEIERGVFRHAVRQIISREELMSFVSRAVRTREDHILYRSRYTPLEVASGLFSEKYTQHYTALINV